MASLEQFTIPRYLKIAVDLSTRIASGEISEGEKLKGRSVLSTEYNVSPETIRRAISILADKKVVRVYLGSGIVVSSRENAAQFLQSFQDSESMTEIRQRLLERIDQRKTLDQEILALTEQMIEMYKYRRYDLITPVEIPIPAQSHVIGQSIGALEVWHNTGATIIGIRQGKNVIVSPGPYYEFAENDHVLIVGDEKVIERFNAFLIG